MGTASGQVDRLVTLSMRGSAVMTAPMLSIGV
jgi:hypothetical protein